ncbi:hypothetical protein AG1IA_05378 [Rhizoctonia solani AG-1 IA]|uniref:Uncharacterized protein n=1 Tax=Thanatephorus cucumeris (strain AG1-IA) TaxID=983506 RepID=L8WUW8_THACA|nr:hypothetical protein AG1IA_05378 [Rhizoctonia solani AG-1 IA]
MLAREVAPTNREVTGTSMPGIDKTINSEGDSEDRPVDGGDKIRSWDDNASSQDRKQVQIQAQAKQSHTGRRDAVIYGPRVPHPRPTSITLPLPPASRTPLVVRESEFCQHYLLAILPTIFRCTKPSLSPTAPLSFSRTKNDVQRHAPQPSVHWLCLSQCSPCHSPALHS